MASFNGFSKIAAQTVGVPLKKAATAVDGQDVERWSRRQVEFISEARRSARHALFYLRLFDPDLPQHGTWILEQVKKRLHTLRIPGDAECSWDSVGEEGRGGSSFSGAPLRWEQLLPVWAKCLHLAGAEADWAAEWGIEPPPTPESLDAKIKDLDEELVTFLKKSVPRRLGRRVTYVRVPAFLAFLRQHQGLLIGLATATLVIFGVQAVRSLFLNRLPLSFCAFLAVLGVPVGLLLRQRWIRRERKNEEKRTAPRWDRGGRTHRSVWPLVSPPQPWLPRHPDGFGRLIPPSQGMALGILLLGWVILGAGFRLFGGSVALTVFLIMALLAVITMIGGALDFIDLHSQPPVRRSLLIGAAAYLFGIIQFDSTWAAVGIAGFWLLIVVFWSWAVGFGRISYAYAFVFILVMVGLRFSTNRRAEHTWRAEAEAISAYLMDEGDWPAGGLEANLPPVVVLAASGGGSRAAIYTALTLEQLEEMPGIGENLQAISSVSGGSLATATFVADRMRQMPSSEMADPGCTGTLSSLMEEDFVQPVLFGVLPFFGGRGEAIERKWRDCLGLGQVTLEDLQRVWRTRMAAGDTLPPFPVPLFNSMTLQRHAVVITPLIRDMYEFGPIDTEAWGNDSGYELTENEGLPTWVFYRSGVYGLDYLLPGFNPMLSQAVRASANFPFGFPLVELETESPLVFSPRPADRGPGLKPVRLTDGGALSNSGLWSLFRLLIDQKERLKERGVLLIIVDANKMPEFRRPNRLTGLAGAILDKNPKGEFLHHLMIEQLGEMYGECFASVAIETLPLQSRNIHTTWALDGRSVENLRNVFGEEWRTEGPRIRQAFSLLQGCDPRNPNRWRMGSRVPLS